jgi:hydroxyethylthiazole kinase-like uncharacterized protein yjeF
MIELLTNTGMAQADRLTVTGGTAGIDLMEKAGLAVADVAARRPLGSRIMIVAGPGNNGGDGFVAARLLADRGYSVRVMLAGEPTKLKGDAALTARRWNRAIEQAAPDRLGGVDLIVDALFGAGLDRRVEGLARDLIEAINESGAPVVAVDLPSGINGDSGAVMGAAVNATETVTFFRKKPGHLLLPGRLHCGRVTVADIGIPATVLETVCPSTSVNCPELWNMSLRIPQPDAHKYARGHAVVVSGGLASTGAARLAARGALRAGAGLVSIASPPDALMVNAATSLAVMVRQVDGPRALTSLLADRRFNALAIGPGGGVGPALREMVLAALTDERAVVLDADALTSFSDDPQPLFAAIAARPGASTVITPHEGEFARLFSKTSEKIDKTSKLTRARTAAAISRAVVVLKGPDTVVAAPDGRASIADNAPPWLATAGSGDVLAGFVVGLLAQGMPVFEGASAAVWLHGESGNEAGPGLIAEDLPDLLPRIYRRLFHALGKA